METGASLAALAKLLEAQTLLPKEFHLHPKLVQSFEQRRAMARGELPLNWAAAEALALASLAAEGFRIRLSGQDSGRGTFSQRHAILYDYEDGKPYVPLQHVADKQAPVEIFNSPLSEAGVLGIRLRLQHWIALMGLILWEAQFVDFANAAQVIIDQFIHQRRGKMAAAFGTRSCCCLMAWKEWGLEHSSARLERFLRACRRG